MPREELVPPNKPAVFIAPVTAPLSFPPNSVATAHETGAVTSIKARPIAKKIIASELSEIEAASSIEAPERLSPAIRNNSSAPVETNPFYQPVA